MRKSENPFGDDVPLDLGGASADRERRRRTDIPLAQIGLDREHPSGTVEILCELHDLLAVIVGHCLANRGLGPRFAALENRADRPQPEKS